MSKDTKPLTLDKDVEERLIELQKENCDGVDHFHFHIHYSVMEQFLATEIKAAEEKTLYFDNFEKIVEDIGQNWTAEQMDELISRITDWRDAELAAMQDSL